MKKLVPETLLIPVPSINEGGEIEEEQTDKKNTVGYDSINDKKSYTESVSGISKLD